MKTDGSVAERVRQRMQRWMELTAVSQRDFADELHKTQPWLHAILAGKNDVRLQDLDDVARAMRTTASELVRADDERYQLELTPTEVRVIEQLRRRPNTYQGITMLLGIPALAPAEQPAPGVTVKRQRKD